MAPELFNDNSELSVVSEGAKYGFISYKVVDNEKVESALSQRSPQEAETIEGKIEDIGEANKQSALADMCVFPAVMLVAYVLLGLYFKSRGGYQAQVLTGHEAEDARFTGGVEGPADR